jgi:hypothetical protein
MSLHTVTKLLAIVVGGFLVATAGVEVYRALTR